MSLNKIKKLFSVLKMEPNKLDENLLLRFKPDPYKGATFLHDNFPKDPTEFSKMLKYTLEHLNTNKNRGIWLRINIEQSALIPVATTQGFVFHHCKPEYVMLTQWLPQKEINKLPHYSSHYVGVGGICINKEKKEILMIQEKISPIDNLWKFPGGQVDENEFLSEAVEREVFEETGIKSKFKCIVSVREKKSFRFGQPDIYFSTLCEPLTYDIDIDPQEIKCAKWMSMEEFMAIPIEFDFQRFQHNIVKSCFSLILDGKAELKSKDLLGILGLKGESYYTPSLKKNVTPISGDPDNIIYFSKIVDELNKNHSKL